MEQRINAQCTGEAFGRFLLGGQRGASGDDDRLRVLHQEDDQVVLRVLRQWYAYHAGFTPAHLELFTQVRYAEFARLGLNACCAECLSFSRDRIL